MGGLLSAGMHDNKRKYRRKINLDRRRVLLGATSVVGTAALAAAAVPFIDSMNPSAAVQARAWAAYHRELA